MNGASDDGKSPYIQAVLICCEGAAELRYFELLARLYDTEYSPLVKVIGWQKQHMKLVDNTLLRRDELAKDLDLAKNEIECWAVCDADKMPCPYDELVAYAEERGVHLAFSDPQFEAFLLQHYGASNATRQSRLYAELTEKKRENGFDGPYDKVSDGIRFFTSAVEDDPGMIEVGIANANLRTNPRKKPFFTVQILCERLLSLYREGQ